ncbi:hypothetical protein [Microbacterium testaceum]|nr:hypothetical protein [Microbacterium testaceum]
MPVTARTVDPTLAVPVIEGDGALVKGAGAEVCAALVWEAGV